MNLEDYKYYEDKAGVIYCGDCLEILPKIPDGSVDLVITSPPYYDKPYRGHNIYSKPLYQKEFKPLRR